MAAPRPPSFLNPRSAGEKNLLANAMRFLQGGMATQARLQCEQVLRTNPRSAAALYMLGLIAARAGQFEDAARRMGESLQIEPDNPAALNNHAVALRKLGRAAEAIASLERAVALQTTYVEAHYNLANALSDAGQFARAIESYRKAVALKSDLLQAHLGLGRALAATGQAEDALQCFDRAIALNPQSADALAAKADALVEAGRLDEALTCARLAVRLQAQSAVAFVSLGNVLARLRRYEESLDAFARAIELNPGDAAAHANRGGLLVELNRPDEAMADLDKAIELDPQRPESHESRAQAAALAKRYDEAEHSYRKLCELAPGYRYAMGNLLHAQMLSGHWEGMDELHSAVKAALRAGEPAAEPFGYQGVADSEQDLLTCARLFAQAEYPAIELPPPLAPVERGDSRITIGYVCGEFREHATSILMCGVWERHDKARFRLIAFDNGGADGSDYRRRIESAFDEIVDISNLGDDAAADAVRQRHVDVLVNLNGYYGRERMGVLARRPSPVQVNYLGFPGTLGAGYIDYLIADDKVIPPSSQPFYVEKVVYLPESYQANDDRRPIAQHGGSRVEAGLPEAGFVFCCFNNRYKITPQTFDSWMRILQRLPGSVLWLIEDFPPASQRLRDEATRRGIDPNRLVFAQRQKPAEHLARHRLADLFLDTLPYNAHTTASDALWAGLPVLTLEGSTFPGRVAASLLKAIGLPELVTHSAQEYEDFAVALATDASRLATLRGRLEANRSTHPLFDTARFTRHLEQAFERMIERHREGLPPAPFGISAQ